MEVHTTLIWIIQTACVTITQLPQITHMLMWFLTAPHCYLLKCMNIKTKLLVFLTILILKKLRKVEELWYQLFNIIGIIHQCLPRGGDGVELSVCTVKPER